MSVITDNDVWEVVKAFFNRYGLVHHQLESYNRFILVGMPTVIERNTPIVVDVGEGREVTIKFNDLFVDKPIYKEFDSPSTAIYPKQCVDRSITYESAVYADIEVVNHLGVSVVYKKYHFANIPTMVLSQLCNLCEVDREEWMKLQEDTYEVGGYFIVKGTKRVLVTQERSSVNTVFVFDKLKKKPKFVLYSEIRSNDHTIGTCTVVGFTKKKETLEVTLPYNDSISVPLGVMLIALGATINDQLMRALIPESLQTKDSIDLITRTLEYSYSVQSRLTALRYIGWKLGKTPLPSNDNVKRQLAKYKCLDKLLKTLDARDPLDDSFYHEAMKILTDSKGLTTGKTLIENMLAVRSRSAEIVAESLLRRDLLPHLGENLMIKLYFICYMVRKLLLVYNSQSESLHGSGKAECSDRDHYMNKRVITAGELLTEQFNVAFRRMRKELIKNVQRSFAQSNSCSISIKPTLIGTSLNTLITANKKNQDDSESVGQVYDEFNFNDRLASLRKLSAPQREGSKLAGPHNLHNSHFGVVGAFETPESEKCGLIKFLGLLGYISNGCDFDAVKEMIVGLTSKITSESIDTDKTVVSIDGCWIGYTSEPESLIHMLRQLRRSGSLNWEVGMCYNAIDCEVRLSICSGRLMRPLFPCEDGSVLISSNDIIRLRNNEMGWQDLIANGVVEFIDKGEEEDTLIAFYPTAVPDDATHCEIHPSSLSSTGDCIIPFLNRNAAARITYEAQQGKQAIGVPGINFQYLMKGIHCYLHYPQRAIVSTRMADAIGVNEQPTGVNAMVMVMPYDGANQEDSLYFNQDSIDRGFMRITKIMTYDTVIKSLQSKIYMTTTDDSVRESEFVCVPTEEMCNIYKRSTAKLESDGIVGVGMIVEDGDMLIGKVTPNLTAQNGGDDNYKKYIDVSVVYDKPWPATITAVQRGINADGYEYIRVQVSQTRDIIDGDKCCLTDDHEVLTRGGWKSIAKVTLQDEVMCLDPETGNMTYDEPTELHAYLHNGDMIHEQSDGVDLLVTPNHKMYVKFPERDKYELIPASELGNTPSRYLSHGCNTFGTTTLNAEALERIGRLTYDEPLPQWVWTLDQESCRSLARGMMDHSTGVFESRIEKDVDEFHRLVVHCGWIGVKCIIASSAIIVNPNPKQRHRMHVERNTVHFQGGVYCITVPTHVFLVRRNGSTAWTGNSSRHGQKGTCGARLRSVDLPFTRDGCVPDIVMAASALPSRMTIAQLVECLAAKRICATPITGMSVAELFGKPLVRNNPDIDGTPFGKDFDLDRIVSELKAMGVDGFGKESVINGMTGEQMPALIFYGPVYYQRLKHMVIDKCHARGNKGGRTALTRQPREGRARQGGLRVGQMEKDVLLGQGASGFVRDRMLEQSNNYRMWICSKCGISVIVDSEGKNRACALCNSTDATQVQIPYTTKLLTQEFAAMNIVTRMVDKDFDDEEIVI